LRAKTSPIPEEAPVMSVVFMDSNYELSPVRGELKKAQQFIAGECEE